MSVIRVFCLLAIASVAIQAQRVIDYDNYDYDILKKTIYAEARGEPKEGQIAVTWVIINRARKNRSYWGGNRIAAVCKAPWQFECWNGKSDIQIDERGAFDSIDGWLRDLLEGRIPDNTDGCDHYNNPAKENASWVNNVQLIKVIANHHFYRSYS